MAHATFVSAPASRTSLHDLGRSFEQQTDATAAARTVVKTTSVHSAPIKLALGCAAWFLYLSWAIFDNGAETALALVFVTAIFAIFLGGLLWGGVNAPDAALDREAPRSFEEFVNGDVDIATGLISGREAMIQIVALPLTLAIGGTPIALAWYFIQ